MRTLLSLAVLLLGLCVGTAQQYAALQVLNGGTHGVGAASTTNYGAGFTMDVRKQEKIPLVFTFRCTATNAGFVDLVFERSLDNSTYDGVSTMTWRAIANGTNWVYAATNYTLNGWGYLRLKSIANTNNVAGTTNMVLTYAIKQAD